MIIIKPLNRLISDPSNKKSAVNHKPVASTQNPTVIVAGRGGPLSERDIFLNNRREHSARRGLEADFSFVAKRLGLKIFNKQREPLIITITNTTLSIGRVKSPVGDVANKITVMLWSKLIKIMIGYEDWYWLIKALGNSVIVERSWMLVIALLIKKTATATAGMTVAIPL